jgi:integrase/recombinase XerD
MSKKNETYDVQVYKKPTTEIADVKNAAWMSLSEESQKAYQSDFDLFFKFVNKSPKDVTATDVLKFIEDLQQKEYKNSSINRKIASLSKMFKTLMMAGEVKQNPVDALKQIKNLSFKTSKEVKVSLTLAEVKAAVKLPKRAKQEDIELSMIIRMIAKTGLRVSEFCNIKNKDIKNFDEKNKQIRIVGKGKKERFIFIDNDFFYEVCNVFPMRSETDFLFYRTLQKTTYAPFDRIFVYYAVRDRFLATTGKHVNVHMLRHWYATYKIHVEKRDIKSVSLALGHHSTSLTLDIYVNTSLSPDESKIKI